MQSLLFCPDENCARALTSLVEGLDIAVKRETEVYSAMRSLMAESFDFLIVDCENEATGRLLLRNAHGSAINKGALAVAIVDPETGANALRFGADFLITKPVMPAQAGKVLRLVRSSILGRQQSSVKRATQTSVVKTAAASSQSSNLDLATPMISPSVEHSVDAFSDQQATMSSLPMVDPETAKIAINPVTDTNTKDGDSQDGNEQAHLEEELRIDLPLPIGPGPADPTRTAGVESAPREKPTTKSHPAAKEAATEIKKTQPRLFIVSMVAAIGVILLVVVAIAWHIDFVHSSNDARAPVQSSSTTPTVPPNAAASESLSEATTTAPVQVTPEPRTEEAPALASAPVDSTPGAKVRVGAQDDSARVAPRSLTGLSPGRKSVTTSKPGHTAEIRTIKVDSSGKSSMGAQLTPLTSTVSVDSDPPDAALWMDGRDTGRMTPAQIVVDKPGDHIFEFKKRGYLDETIATNLRMGQTFHLAPSLHAVGRTDEIHIVGKFSKLFRGSATAGMGTVKVKTQPKGAQIAVNTRILDKTSPAEFYLNPGNYAIDITLSGFKLVHRVVSVDKGGKVAIDEVMNHE